jgi:hypothetical protein
MSKKRIKQKRKKSKKEIQTNSAHASLCALAPVIGDKKILEPIHEKVQIEGFTVQQISWYLSFLALCQAVKQCLI